MGSEFDILVVEDEPVVVEAARKILTAEGFKVDAVQDGESVIQKLKEQNHYKLILSDLMLPKLSGFDLLAQVKKTHPEIPIIVITGYATLDNAITSFKMGAFDFIPKPFDVEELLAVVQRALNYKKSSRILDKNQISDAQNKEDKIYCLGEHSWAKMAQGGSVLFGVGQSFFKLIGKVKQIDFPQKDEEIGQGKVFTRLNTEDRLVHSVRAPLSGMVVEHNNELEQNMQLIHDQPFSRGWLVRVIPINLENELDSLTPC